MQVIREGQTHESVHAKQVRTRTLGCQTISAVPRLSPIHKCYLAHATLAGLNDVHTRTSYALFDIQSALPTIESTRPVREPPRRPSRVVTHTRGITLVLSVPVSSNSYMHNQAVSHILHSVPNPQQRSCCSFWVNHACTSALCIDPGKSASARIVLPLSLRAPGTPSSTTVAQLNEMCPLETPRVQCYTSSHALV